VRSEEFVLSGQLTPLEGGRVYDADAVDRYVAHLERLLAEARGSSDRDDAGDDDEVSDGGAVHGILAEARRDAHTELAAARREIHQLLEELSGAVEAVLGRLAGRQGQTLQAAQTERTEA
jgi:hypothetical protein